MDRIFGILIKNVNNDLDRNADEFAHSIGLTRMQMSVIDFISRNEKQQNIFQKDIEKEFNIRRASATSALKLMETKDLIVRVPMPEDARLKRIMLTAKARKMTGTINDYFEKTEKLVDEIVGDKLHAVKTGLAEISEYFNSK